MIKLVPIDNVRPSTYNPRQADPARLDLLELSLRKLGFIHPLFADANGELLSGHQRHLVAQRLGFTHVPVIFTTAMDLAKRKAINIAFNRGTNDYAASDTTGTLKAALDSHNPHGIAARMPDCPNEHRFRCMTPQNVPTSQLVAANAGRWVQYARNIAGTLFRENIVMPIICTPDLRVVNGIGRLQLMAEKKHEEIPVVIISDNEALFANVMLNFLSMDFDIHTRYADLLRYNSFRRPSGVKRWLGRSFTFALVKSNTSKSFDIHDTKNLAIWRKNYGNTVCDFGCGLMDETKILRSVGIDSVPFEPFFLDENREISPLLSRKIVREFLDRIATGVKFDSIFLSAVLNSVPFLEDRKHVVCILNALALPGTKVFAHSASDKATTYTSLNGRELVSRTAARQIKFNLDYEPRITLGELSEKPKVQKYHTPEEWYELWHEFFHRVEVSESQGNVECICMVPLPISQERLKSAIEHEFNLPYPDGSRMGLVDEALDAFRKRQQTTGRIFS